MKQFLLPAHKIVHLTQLLIVGSMADMEALQKIVDNLFIIELLLLIRLPIQLVVVIKTVLSVKPQILRKRFRSFKTTKCN